MRKITKIVLVVLAIFILVINFIPVESQAVQNWSQMQSSANEFIKKGSNDQKLDDNEIAKVIMPIARILVNIATVVLVIVTVIMGIKYMTANPEGQAKLKQQLIGLVVSTVVIFGAQIIWELVYNFMMSTV